LSVDWLIWGCACSALPSRYLDKVKLKLFICLIGQALCHEDSWESGGIAPPFLTSALDRREWSASRSYHFSAGERVPRYLLYWWLGGPQNRSGCCEEEKYLALSGTEPCCPVLAIPTQIFW
jgi:hypothetical protein